LRDDPIKYTQICHLFLALSRKTVDIIHRLAPQSIREKGVLSQVTDNKQATKGSVEVNRLVFCAPIILVADKYE